MSVADGYPPGVFRLPESPRRRRRLIGLSAVAFVVASAAAVIVLLPKGEKIQEQLSSRPAQVAEPAHARLRSADRRAINATLDRFIVAALDRRDPAAAWALAGPGLRGSSTSADWVAGHLPVPVYAVKGMHFPGWTQLDVARDRVSFNVLVQPRAGSKNGALALAVQVIRRAHAWVVNGLYPVATFSPVGQPGKVVGPADFGALGGGDPATSDGTIAGAWIAVPVGLFLFGLVVVALVIGRNWLRYRLARKRFASARNEAMPTLPASVRKHGSTANVE